MPATPAKNWRRDYPRELVYFEAYTLRDRDDAFGKAGEERSAYGGVIETMHTPCSQADYERQVTATLDLYRKMDSVVRIEIRRFRWDGEVRPA